MAWHESAYELCGIRECNMGHREPGKNKVDSGDTSCEVVSLRIGSRGTVLKIPFPKGTLLRLLAYQGVSCFTQSLV